MFRLQNPQSGSYRGALEDVEGNTCTSAGKSVFSYKMVFVEIKTDGNVGTAVADTRRSRDGCSNGFCLHTSDESREYGSADVQLLFPHAEKTAVSGRFHLLYNVIDFTIRGG